MAKNVEINIMDNNDIYEVIYPKANWNNIENKPTIPSTPVSVTNGGTSGTSASAGVYNLINPLSTRTASELNDYANNSYIPCYYGSTSYKFPLSNIITYINNNVSVTKSITAIIKSYNCTGQYGSGDSITISFDSTNIPSNNYLIAVIIVVQSCETDTTTLQDIAKNNNGIFYIDRKGTKFKTSYNGSYGLEATFSKTSLKLGGNSSTNNQYTLKILNSGNGNTNYILGIFGDY